MARIRVDVDYTIADGAEVLFYAPCDYADISSLKVYYPGADGETTSQEFSFKDAHGNDLADLDNLFAAGACIKVILSVTNSSAYVQNADTNKYLEGRFDDIVANYATKVHVEELLAGLESGETPTGNAAALGNKTAEEWQTDIDAKVPNTRKVNGKALSTDITLGISDIDGLQTKEIKDSEVDFNTFTTEGRWYIGSTNTLINAPTGAKMGWLEVTRSSETASLTQTWTENTNTTSGSVSGSVWHRTKYGANWKNWFEHLHEGNFANYALPISGGGTVEFTKYDGFVVKRNSTSNYAFTGIMFENANGKIGMIGFKGGKLQRSETNGSTSYDILDTGNSAKVVVSATAPSDTSSLWVDSANKALKAYIDGAWTVIGLSGAVVDTDPGVGATTSYADGTLIFVKE